MGSGEFRGAFYFKFEVNLKFLFIEMIFFYDFFLNQRNNMVFMIGNRDVKIPGSFQSFNPGIF